MTMSNKKQCIILANLGAPATQEEVYPFLRNLFADKDIFKFPFGKFGQTFFSWLIARLRAPKSQKYYQQIGGGSPLLKNTESQVKKLQKRLGCDSVFRVFHSQRYWHPLVDEVVTNIKTEEFSHLFVIPLYPHYSTTTTLSIINEWKKYAKSLPQMTFLKRFYQRDDYINCCIELIRKKISLFKKNPHILFSAHSIPEKRVLQGDPYKAEIEDHMQKIMQKFKGEYTYSLCYQSKLGPVKWLEPDVETEIDRLISNGIETLLVFPISFVSENLETLYELDREKKEYALYKGIKQFERVDTVSDSDAFIEVLYSLVTEETVKHQ